METKEIGKHISKINKHWCKKKQKQKPKPVTIILANGRGLQIE